MQLPNFITRMLGFAEKAEAHFQAEAKLAEALTKITTLEAELDTLKAAAVQNALQATDLTAKLATAQATGSTQAAEITTLQTAIETEKRKVVETLAAQGISPDLLPPTSPNAQPTGAALDPVTKLRAQLLATTDPQEKFKLSVQIRELLEKARKS